MQAGCRSGAARAGMPAMADLLRSELLSAHGFVHGFSLRTGGTSAAPFDSLNLGRGLGDDPSAVEENHRRFAEALPVGRDRLFEISQVHGRGVRLVGPDDSVPGVREEQGDALATATPGLAVGVRIADCVPILVADPRTGAVAAIHAGWRGTVVRVIEAAIEVLVERADVRPGDLVAAVFPHIRLAAFEVGDEVASEIAAAAGTSEVIDRSYPKPHADLGRVVRTQLVGLGLDASRIDDVAGCTFTDPRRFFSFRRDGRNSGRHLAAIVGRAPS